MTPNRWAVVKNVLEAALDRPASERSDFLAEACAADEALRAEVEALLEAHVEAGELLDHSPKAPASLIGTTAGSYRILEMLGAGGMGEVYLALDTRLGRRVALKFLSSEFTSDPDRVRRFHQEARAASALNHPNILTIYELGQHQGVQFIASELVEGETLRARLKRGPMELSEILRVVSQLTSALRTAHAAGVIHRDIKPENVMLRPDGYVKVLDFGLAKLAEPSTPEADEATVLRTAAGVVMGTMHYMSPEQLRGEIVDARTDQWSLGVVLYEMLGGRRPFEGSTGSDVIAAILGKEQPPLQGPEELRRITAKLLRKKSEERYTTASELSEELSSFQKQSDERPASPSGKLRVAGFAAAVVIVAAVILVLNRDRIFRGKASPPAEIRSIAVLPFKNVSGDARNQYLSDGMAEELIDSLGRIPELKVVSRTSSFAIERTSKDIREVGTNLGVGSVIEGSVRRSGNRLQVGARLVNTADGQEMWTDTYEGELTEIFKIQNEIVSAVAKALTMRLGIQQKRSRPTEDLQAYELYLKGRQSGYRWTRDGINNAVAYFRGAIERDPSFAAAWAGLADTYAVMDHRVGLTSLKPRDSYRLAEEAARMALSLDPQSAEGHSALGHIQTHRGQWADAEKNLKRALELNPNAVMSRLWYAAYLQTMQRTTEVKEQFVRAREIDPLSVQVSQQAGSLLWYGSDFESAIDFTRQGLEIAPEYGELHLFLARSLAMQGRFKEAEESTRRAARAKEARSFVEEDTAMIIAAAGRKNEAREALRRIEQEKQKPHAPSMMRAYAAVGDLDDAVRWMNRAVQTNEFHARVNLNVPRHPLFARFINDYRFRDARHALGLPPIAPVTDAPAAPSGIRVVVLPFENLTHKPGDDWLSPALAISLTFGLQSLDDLIVVNPDRVAELYKERSVRQAGPLDAKLVQGIVELLTVRYYVHGSYQRVGEDIKVVARLADVDAVTIGAQESVTDRFANILRLEDDLARRFATRLAAGNYIHVKREETSSVQAYEAFMEARTLYGGGDFNTDLIDRLKRAVALDPAYAQAWALLGKTYARLASPAFVSGDSVHEYRRESLVAARRAAELSPSLYDAHVALALAHRENGQYSSWRAEAQRAMALNPRQSEAYGLLGDSYFTGPVWGCARDRNVTLAENYYRQAIAIDPRFAAGHWSRIISLRWGGQPQKALEAADEALQTFPTSSLVRRQRNDTLVALNRIEEAERGMQELIRGRAPSGLELLTLGSIDLRRGRDAEAEKKFAQALALSPTVDYEVIIGSYYATTGRADEARARLSRAFERDRACAQFVASSPAFAQFAAQPQTRVLLAKYGAK